MKNRNCTNPACGQRHYAKGLCRQCYDIAWRAMQPKRVKPTREEIYWARVEHGLSEDECWPWLGSLNSKGYGRVQIDGTFYQAHRLSYQLLVGEIPEGLQLDHLCRNRRCVNPKHLEPVTARVNILRGQAPAADNAKKDRCPRGHLYDVLYRAGRGCRACKNAATTQYLSSENGRARRRRYQRSVAAAKAAQR